MKLMPKFSSNSYNFILNHHLALHSMHQTTSAMDLDCTSQICLCGVWYAKNLQTGADLRVIEVLQLVQPTTCGHFGCFSALLVC